MESIRKNTQKVNNEDALEEEIPFFEDEDGT